MAKNIMICTTNEVDYISVRKAMIAGARTKAEVKEMTGACLECESCGAHLDWILASVCGCKEVSLKTVVDAVKSGANTIEEVVAETKAGSGEDCGRCQALIANIIELGR